jgi:hypothetical protein
MIQRARTKLYLRLTSYTVFAGLGIYFFTQSKYIEGLLTFILNELSRIANLIESK